MEKTVEQLRSILLDIANEENYTSCKIDIKPITSDGANYTTDLYLGTIMEPPKPNIDIFAKAANLSEEARHGNEFMARVYKIEALFYSEIATDFDTIYNKHKVSAEDRLLMPKYYKHVLIPYEEVLVLENLEASGYKMFDRMKTYDWEYAATAVTQMAKLHAIGLSYRIEYPIKFENFYNDFIIDFDKDQEKMEIFLQQAIQSACECVSEENGKRLLNFFSSKDIMTNISKLMTEDKTMLVHGDFRPSNLMHRKQNEQMEVVVLDYQTLRLANPVLDLIYFIFSGSDTEFRRLHYQRLLDHYYTQLSLALGHLNIDVETVYPKKTFETNLIEMRPLGLMFGLIMAGMVTVAPEDAPKVDGDLSNMHIKPNELAKERICGIVTDFINWGVI